jgi:hypothetical protein
VVVALPLEEQSFAYCSCLEEVASVEAAASLVAASVEPVLLEHFDQHMGGATSLIPACLASSACFCLASLDQADSAVCRASLGQIQLDWLLRPLE